MEQTPPLALIVGLGNPGPRYAATRHNIGFAAVTELAQHYQTELRMNRRFNCLCGQTKTGSGNLILALPQTFMNLSGYAVQTLAAYYRISAEAIAVVHDDLDLDFGRIKLSRQRGAAGHRGVSSLLECLESQDFARLRLGIGRPNWGEAVESYVLNEFYPQQKDGLAQLLDQARQCLLYMIEEGVDKAMGLINRRRPTPAPADSPP
jgi:PTH1 family peptidyl-tRNA hydrolase